MGHRAGMHTGMLLLAGYFVLAGCGGHESRS